jgi:hypothetical protein
MEFFRPGDNWFGKVKAASESKIVRTAPENNLLVTIARAFNRIAVAATVVRCSG